MSLNTVIAFALLLKKITKKRALASKKKKKCNNMNDSSESEKEEYNQISEIIEEKRKSIPSTKTASVISITSSSITQKHPPKSMVSTSHSSTDKLQSKVSELDLKQQKSPHDVTIRDFAYPTDSPLHYGQPPINNASAVSLSHPEFNGRDARALFDFTPETEYEIGLKAGQTIWIQYRQCPGWLIADVHDETGLVPESYVEFI